MKRNRGSVIPTEDPRKWRLVISVKDEVGNRQRLWKTVYSKSETEAWEAIEDWRSDIRNDREKLKHDKDAPLLTREWLAAWLEQVKADPEIRPGTFRSYAQHVRDHINLVIGSIALAELKAADIKKVSRSVLASGCSPSTAHRVFATIRRALKVAEMDEVVKDFASPVRNVQPPKQKLQRIHINLDAVEAILDRLDADEELGRFYRVAFSTGLRRGELQGMTWKSTDLDRGVITVAQTLVREPGRGIVPGKPKSDTSNRKIHLDADTIGLLREQQEQQDAWRADHPDVWTDTDYVWADPLGIPVRPERLTKGFKRAAVAVGHPELHLHHLRHAHAFALVELGAHARTVQQRLGHSSSAFTLKVYVSDSDALDAEAANQFGGRFGRKSGRTGDGKGTEEETKAVLETV